MADPNEVKFQGFCPAAKLCIFLLITPIAESKVFSREESSSSLCCLTVSKKSPCALKFIASCSKAVFSVCTVSFRLCSAARKFCASCCREPDSTCVQDE